MLATLGRRSRGTRSATAAAATQARPPQPAPEAAGPILVASDGSGSADFAVRAARVVSRGGAVPVQMVSVLEPVAAIAPAPLLAGLPANVDAERAGERLDVIREQRRLVGGDQGWSIEVKFGSPAQVIARMAKERNARLIVMGLNPHGAVDRLLGGDTVFDVVRLGETPVLVASERMDERPRTLVIGVDFSPLSTHAAHLAVSMFGDAADIYLVHVGPAPDTTIHGWYDLGHSETVSDGFQNVRAVLNETSGKIETVELMGKPERELAQFARDVRADIVVVGSYRRGLLRRITSGTMAANVLRAAPCPVLVVPEPAAGIRVPETNARESGRESLAATLHDVSVRNAGRRTVVEIDNPAIGAQALAFDYALLGIDYDRHSDRAHIYLGDKAGTGSRHATHSVTAPTRVDVMRGLDGRDQVVRIADEAGQALVTFW